MSDGESMDAFMQGLKHNIPLEVLKSSATAFEEAARMSLRIDGAMWMAMSDIKKNRSYPHDRPVPMEITLNTDKLAKKASVKLRESRIRQEMLTLRVIRSDIDLGSMHKRILLKLFVVDEGPTSDDDDSGN